MEQISDYRRWASDMQMSLPLSNLCLLPDQLQRLAEAGRLRGMSRGRSRMLLVDEGEYDALYFHMDAAGRLELPKQEKPVMAELVYRTGQEAQIREAEKLLSDAGFSLRTRCFHFSAPVGPWGVDESCAYSIGTARPAHAEMIEVLWKQHLSCYDFHENSRNRLDYLIDREQVLCAVDRNGKVCAAALLDIQGKRLSCRHMVVCPEQRGKGLGRKLLQYAAAYGCKQGCRTMSQWVAEDNLPSLALHRGLMKQTNKIMAQYVLE